MPAPPSEDTPDFDYRATKAAEALRAHPAVAYAGVSIEFRDIWAGLKTNSTRELEKIELIFGLEHPTVSLKHTVEHGVVLDIWWDFTVDVEPLPNDKTYDEFIDELPEEQIWADYLEDTLASPPDDSGFNLLPEHIPNTIPKHDQFPLSPPGWNYAGYQWLADQEDYNGAYDSAALYFCQFRDSIAKLWLHQNKENNTYHLELVEYPGETSVIEFTTTEADLITEVYSAAEAWLQSCISNQPPGLADDFKNQL